MFFLLIQKIAGSKPEAGLYFKINLPRQSPYCVAKIWSYIAQQSVIPGRFKHELDLCTLVD
jgi:hypothetical protein